MAGNILGRRSFYTYTDDTGQNFSIRMDDTLALAVNATPDDASPLLPRNLKPRVVFVERVLNGRVARKSLVVPTLENALFARNTTITVPIDGLDFGSTGRRGESISYARNADPTDPGDDDGSDGDGGAGDAAGGAGTGGAAGGAGG